MRRREFLGGAVSATVMSAVGQRAAASGAKGSAADAAAPSAGEPRGPAPLAVGLVIDPAHGGEESIRNVQELGMTNCFLLLDGYLGRYSKALAQQLAGWLEKHRVVATAVDVVGPGPLQWDFLHAPSTIGLVPRATRPARIDALKQTSDFAALLGIGQVQTLCGFIPEDPANPLYEETVSVIVEVARHCAGNGQMFLMETAHETPTTTLRALTDVAQPNVGVGLDTGNLIVYGKANPSDALDILGTHVRGFHAKDGEWPTNPIYPGKEVLIGTGRVDFRTVLSKLRQIGFEGSVTIERGISGPQQIVDVRQERAYLEGILKGPGDEQS
jgi:L-ribulose-5-phosphate 3-epimerase